MILEKFRLDGRVALVTGASSGIGMACSLGLAEAGARLVIGARRLDRLNMVAAELRHAGAEVIVSRCDVSERESCDRMVSAAVQAFGSVDVLVNNAGVAAAVPATHEAEEHFRQILDVNLMGAYWMAQSCGRVMRPGSSIVNISSVLALTTAELPQAAYTASKSGLLGLTRDLSQQWGRSRKGIRVNALLPGFFATEMTGEYSPDYLSELLLRRVPEGRLGELWECVAAILFLASDAASYINGVSLPVDGGLLIT